MSTYQSQEPPTISTGRFKPWVILRRYFILSIILILLGTAAAVQYFSEIVIHLYCDCLSDRFAQVYQ
ncbi:MAG: hypothetical protein R3E08_03695 [Thiotrichaceae bacterium]